jgi:hypothetical protein
MIALEVDDGKTLSLTFSPIHLALPVVELTAEIAATDQLGLAVILGGGAYRGFGVIEAGAQARYYAVGDFDHGMQLGVEVLGVHVFSDNALGTGIAGFGTGVAAGPFIGYKFAADFGLTLDVQLGAAWAFIRADAGGATANDTDFLPILNLNAGWSF